MCREYYSGNLQINSEIHFQLSEKTKQKYKKQKTKQINKQTKQKQKQNKFVKFLSLAVKQAKVNQNHN